MRPGGRPISVSAFGLAVAALLPLAACAPSDPDTATPVAYRAIFGDVGISPGQFSYPRAMDSDAKSLWIIDKMARVQRLDAKTHVCLALWQMPDWKLGKPTGICVWSPDGPDADSLRIFIPDTHYHRVMVYRPNPAPTSLADAFILEQSFGAYGQGDGQFIYPTDVVVIPASDGRSPQKLYISEYGGHDRISIYERDPDGAYRFVKAFGQFGTGLGDGRSAPVEFNRPQAMELDRARGELVIADACNHRIGRFNLDGTLISWIGVRKSDGEGSDQFKYPYGLCLLNDDTALISEFGGNRVSRVDLKAGKVIAAYGTPGRRPGDLATPWGVTAIGGDAFILDSGNNRVVQFDAPSPRAVTEAALAQSASAKKVGGG
jgi:hypothetical protein